MTFQEFIAQYDHDNSIILIEGKRNVQDTDREKLVALGRCWPQKHRGCLSEVVMQTALTNCFQRVLLRLITRDYRLLHHIRVIGEKPTKLTSQLHLTK